MGNDRQLVEPPALPTFSDLSQATGSAVTSKDGIIAFQTPLEPIESRQTLLNEQKISEKSRRRPSSTFFNFYADKLFALILLILLILLIAYIIFHGRLIDNQLHRLQNSREIQSNDLRQILQEINLRLKSIENLLVEQSKKNTINLQLNGQDIRDFSTNQTVLQEFLRRFRERL